MFGNVRAEPRLAGKSVATISGTWSVFFSTRRTALKVKIDELRRPVLAHRDRKQPDCRHRQPIGYRRDLADSATNRPVAVEGMRTDEDDHQDQFEQVNRHEGAEVSQRGRKGSRNHPPCCRQIGGSKKNESHANKMK